MKNEICSSKMCGILEILIKSLTNVALSLLWMLMVWMGWDTPRPLPMGNRIKLVQDSSIKHLFVAIWHFGKLVRFGIHQMFCFVLFIMFCLIYYKCSILFFAMSMQSFKEAITRNCKFVHSQFFWQLVFAIKTGLDFIH